MWPSFPCPHSFSIITSTTSPSSHAYPFVSPDPSDLPIPFHSAAGIVPVNTSVVNLPCAPFDTADRHYFCHGIASHSPPASELPVPDFGSISSSDAEEEATHRGNKFEPHGATHDEGEHAGRYWRCVYDVWSFSDIPDLESAVDSDSSEDDVVENSSDDEWCVAVASTVRLGASLNHFTLL